MSAPDRVRREAFGPCPRCGEEMSKELRGKVEGSTSVSWTDGRTPVCSGCDSDERLVLGGLAADQRILPSWRKQEAKLHVEAAARALEAEKREREEDRRRKRDPVWQAEEAAHAKAVEQVNAVEDLARWRSLGKEWQHLQQKWRDLAYAARVDRQAADEAARLSKPPTATSRRKAISA